MPKKPIEITGPDGKKYNAMFDGYQDFTNIGMGHLPQITVNDEAPGITKNTTTYGPTLEKAGYKLPELPKQELTSGSFMPSKHPMAVKEAAVQNKKTGKIYTGAYHAEANLKYLEETNPGDPSNEARAWGMVENPDSGMIDGFKTNAGEFLNRNQAFDRAVQMGQYVPHAAWESARAGLEAVSFNKQQGREGIPEGSRPGHYNPEASYLPRKSYAEAQKDEGNPYVRKSATPEADANPGYMPSTPQKETTGWLLPDHTWTPTSTGPMGHAENLAHNAPAYTEAFGAGLSGNVNDAERLNAVNKGFVRFRNYAGDLTIETNERHWENQKASVLRRLLDNQDDLHRVDIRIVTDDGKFLSGKGRTLSETQNKEEALKDLVNEVKIPQGTPVSSEPTLIQRARALPGEEGTPAFMPRKPPGNLDQKDLYVIRHGSTPANEDGLTRGWSTVPLSADGKREANEAGIQLGGHGLDRIVTSDLNRAKQTANIISEHTGAPVEVNPGLRSWGFGPKLENKPVEEVHKLLQKLVNNPDTRPEGEYPDGVKPETFNEYKHRIFSTVEGIQNKYPEGKTAIITHYRTMRALEARTKGHEIDVPKFLEKGTDNPAEIKYLKNGKLTTQLPKPGFMPNRGYIGTITSNGEIQAEEGSLKNREHADYGFSDNDAENWRYNPRTKKIYWWHPYAVSDAFKEKVKDWLEASGESPEQHAGIERNFYAAHGIEGKVEVNPYTGHNFMPRKKERGPIWYSQLSRTIDDKMPNSASGEQVLNIARSGAKADEVKWSGLDDFLKGKDKVTKAEVQKYLTDNQLQVKEITKGGEQPDVEAWWNDEGGANETTPFSELTPQEQRRARNQYQADVGQYEEGASKFENYQLPGGKNYREMLFQLPSKEPTKTEFRVEEKGGQAYEWFDTRSEAEKYLAQRPDAENFQIVERAAPVTKQGFKDFHSSHWDEPNVLAHARINDRVDAEGKPGLFAEELQSDWHQRGRKEGYAKSKPIWAVLNDAGALVGKDFPSRGEAEAAARSTGRQKP